MREEYRRSNELLMEQRLKGERSLAELQAAVLRDTAEEATKAQEAQREQRQNANENSVQHVNNEESYIWRLGQLALGLGSFAGRNLLSAAQGIGSAAASALQPTADQITRAEMKSRSAELGALAGQPEVALPAPAPATQYQSPPAEQAARIQQAPAPAPATQYQSPPAEQAARIQQAPAPTPVVLPAPTRRGSVSAQQQQAPQKPLTPVQLALQRRVGSLIIDEYPPSSRAQQAAQQQIVYEESQPYLGKAQAYGRAETLARDLGQAGLYRPNIGNPIQQSNTSSLTPTQIQAAQAEANRPLFGQPFAWSGNDPNAQRLYEEANRKAQAAQPATPLTPPQELAQFRKATGEYGWAQQRLGNLSIDKSNEELVAEARAREQAAQAQPQAQAPAAPRQYESNEEYQARLRRDQEARRRSAAATGQRVRVGGRRSLYEKTPSTRKKTMRRKRISSRTSRRRRTV
jgi:hypothetical protein